MKTFDDLKASEPVCRCSMDFASRNIFTNGFREWLVVFDVADFVSKEFDPFSVVYRIVTITDDYVAVGSSHKMNKVVVFQTDKGAYLTFALSEIKHCKIALYENE